MLVLTKSLSRGWFYVPFKGHSQWHDRCQENFQYTDPKTYIAWAGLKCRIYPKPTYVAWAWFVCFLLIYPKAYVCCLGSFNLSIKQHLVQVATPLLIECPFKGLFNRYPKCRINGRISVFYTMFHRFFLVQVSVPLSLFYYCMDLSGLLDRMSMD